MTESTPARAFSGTPPPPPGDHDLRIAGETRTKVFIDTNTYFQRSYHQALDASVYAGDLDVYWSKEILKEILRVAERVVATATSQHVADLPIDQQNIVMEAALDRIRLVVGNQVEILHRYFRLAPAPPNLTALALDDVVDPDDRLHIRSARAAGAGYFLSLDNRHLPHGATYGGVACWHPDTFLTLFYQQNPDAYDRAKRSIEDLPNALKIRLLPHVEP
jgi:predicted nucleic acid-binding protein